MEEAHCSKDSTCSDCHTLFTSIMELKRHKLYRRCFSNVGHNNVESADAQQPNPTLTNSLECENCSHRFSSRQNLNLHIKNRTCFKTTAASNSLECENCRHRFSSRQNFNHHIEKRICFKTTQSSAGLKCPNCHRCFANERNLATHIRKRICAKRNSPSEEPLSKRPRVTLADSTNVLNHSTTPLKIVHTPTENIEVHEQDYRPYREYHEHARAHQMFQKEFICDEFGKPCFVCDRLWYNSSLRQIPANSHSLLLQEFNLDDSFDIGNVKVCCTCYNSLRKNRFPNLAISNGFKYCQKPEHLPPLNAISERFISPRIPFLQIRRLRHCCGQYAACGQIINVPIEIDTMLKKLPRNADDDFCINVNLKKKVYHKSSFLTGFVQKGHIRKWLEYLIKTPLYILYGITIDESFLPVNADNSVTQEEYELLEEAQIEELHTAHQQTLLWSEERYLNLAPGANSVPKSILFDIHCEELSFPTIYYGQLRKFNDNIKVTPFMIATSEIRRKDRRGVRPDHLLYIAMKILRLRVRDSLTVAFKLISSDTKITKEQVLNREFLNNCMEKNLAFLKSLPNSAFYWQMRKRDLFAMLRQLGKPTIFLTFSANEIQWPQLLSTLHRLVSGIHIDREEILQHLTPLQKADLINNDAVTCAIHFDHLVHVILKILSSKAVSPFGNHYVVEYFYRIEFQNRGSPHCHALLWLNEAPRNILHDAEGIIQLVDKLISVSRVDSSGHSDKQTHKHTFTCTKNLFRNDPDLNDYIPNSSASLPCRFDIPFLPMRETKLIVPMNVDDGRRKEYKKHYRRYQKSLEANNFRDIEHFFEFNQIHSDEFYEAVISAGIVRPRIFLRRHPSESMINNYNPFLLSVIGANMDFQYILDEYSCATYVVEYVNKSDRGISDLQRKIVELQQKYPDFDFSDITRKLSIDLLNTVEMSAQEAAWFLLHLSMSKSSIKVEYINTVWPSDREHCRKPLKVIENPEIPNDSTDIWMPNIIELYQKRPPQYENLCLAEMVSNFKYVACKKSWRQRKRQIVIRYRHYDPNRETENFMREQVLLYIPFRNEEEEIIADHKYIQIFQQHSEEIIEKRKLFESDLDIHETLELCKNLCIIDEEDDCEERLRKQIRQDADRDPLADFYKDPAADINSDLFHALIGRLTAVIGKKQNIKSKEEFNELVRKTNPLQRGIIIHAIARLRGSTSIAENIQEPIQCFFTGPAGSGKTFVINVLMEVYNRFSQTDGLCNAYISCGTTGRAACAINGTTIHTAFTLTIHRRENHFALSLHQLNQYRTIFKFVRVIIIDEISMCSSDLLHCINYRLQEITGNFDKPFGGLDIFLIGDLRQLPPVRATPIFKQSKNRMTGLSLWRNLQFYELDTVMRQSDEEFSNLLTAIGNGEKLTQQQQNLIESRFVSNSSINTVCPNAIRLFYSNNKVDKFNNSVLSTCQNFVSIADDTYTGYANDAQLQQMRQQVNKMKTADMNGLPYEVMLVIDKMYMITKNIDVVDGLANGSIGKLKLIEYYSNDEPLLPNIDLESDEQETVCHPADFVTVVARIDEVNPIEINDRNVQVQASLRMKRLWMEFQSQNIGVKARLKAGTYMAENNISSNWTPIHQMSTTKSLGRGLVSKTIKRKQFPTVAACAITIHKSQGGTFQELVYEYERTHEHSLVYVALSRATCLSGLHLTSPHDDFTFYHGKNEARSTESVKQEYQRLRGNKLMTIQDQMMEKIQAASEEHLIFTVFNCQSLRRNVKNLTDPITDQSHLLLLSETWLQSDEEVPNITNFKVVSRFKNSADAVRGGGVAICIRNDKISNIANPSTDSVTHSKTGDSCVVHYNSCGTIIKFVCLYIRPHTGLNEMKTFLEQILALYNQNYQNIPDISAEKQKNNVPLIVAGDFNIDFASTSGEQLIAWLNETFDLKYCTCNRISTTINQTIIDGIFYKGVTQIDNYVYISHFSYHKPIVSIIR